MALSLVPSSGGEEASAAEAYHTVVGDRALAVISPGEVFHGQKAEDGDLARPLRSHWPFHLQAARTAKGENGRFSHSPMANRLRSLD
jgi:hypothetical protein